MFDLTVEKYKELVEVIKESSANPVYVSNRISELRRIRLAQYNPASFFTVENCLGKNIWLNIQYEEVRDWYVETEVNITPTESDDVYYALNVDYSIKIKNDFTNEDDYECNGSVILDAVYYPLISVTYTDEELALQAYENHFGVSTSVVVENGKNCVLKEVAKEIANHFLKNQFNSRSLYRSGINVELSPICIDEIIKLIDNSLKNTFVNALVELNASDYICVEDIFYDLNEKISQLQHNPALRKKGISIMANEFDIHFTLEQLYTIKEIIDTEWE